MPRSKSTSTLRQQRLSFATLKRTSSSGNKKPPGNPKSESVVLDLSDDIDLSSSEDEDEQIQVVRSPHKDKRVIEPRIKNKGLLQFPGRTTKKLTP